MPEQSEGESLESTLIRYVPELSKKTARVALDIGAVFLRNKRCKQGTDRVHEGDHVSVVLGGAFHRALAQQCEANAIPPPAPAVVVLHEDEHILVVVKPTGLLTAPTPESDGNNLMSHLQASRPEERLYVVHRLDLATSGVMVVAKSVTANRSLSELFRLHRLTRRYDAFLSGRVSWEQHDVQLALRGKKATTRFKVTDRFRQITRVDATLETGRTHQIRLHAQSLGYPVVSDPAYGKALLRARGIRAPRLALHARYLAFEHPVTKTPLNWESPLPEALERWAASLER